MRLRPFLIILGLLGLLHAYIGSRVLPDLPVGTGVRYGGAALLVASYLLISTGIVARFTQPRPRADRLAAPGLLLLSLFSSLLVLTLLRDVLLLPVVFGLSAVSAHSVKSTSAVLVVVLSALATGIGFAEARGRARVVRVDIPLMNLPRALHGFSIAQISDVHVGSAIRKDYVDAIVDAVNDLRADVIAVTGDLVDGSVQELAPHTAPLARLRARHGAFFVTGNHEYYSGANAWIDELRRLGLHVLLNEHAVVKHGGAEVVVAGVTDYSSHHFNPAQHSDPAAALSGAPAGAGARILLAHQPRSAPAAATAGFDLQLSGHTHGGQFWPWNLFVRFQQPFTAGLHRLNALWVYVSRGTGYWGPPNRFGAPSEITHLRLVSAD